MSLPVARIWDPDYVHCSTPIRAKGSPDVLVNKRMWNRLGDLNFPHLKPCKGDCCIHTHPIVKASDTVFVNKIAAGRVFDPTCTAVAKGSPNVLAG